MTVLTRPMRTHPLPSFVVLACLLGWALVLASVFRGEGETNLNPLGPGLAAALVAACAGRAGLRWWWRRLRTVAASPGLYAIAVFGPSAISIGAVLAAVALGSTMPSGEQLAGWVELPVTFLFLLVFIGIGEEAGWTAFATPYLLERRTILGAWAVLAAIRIFWHLPLMLSGDLPLSLGVVGNAAFQFVLLWLFLRGRGVWFLAAVWHAVLNTWGGEFFNPMFQGADAARLALILTGLYVALAIALYSFDRGLFSGSADYPRLREDPSPYGLPA